MSFYQSTYHIKVYRNFKAIEPTAYQSIIRFYEEFKPDLLQLEFDEYFEVLIIYVQALFEFGSYERHLVVVDEVIELSIDHNIKYYEGIDIYQAMLFKKAASYYNINQFKNAEYIVRELIKISPADLDYHQFARKIFRKRNHTILKLSRALAMFLFLSSALLICFEVLLIRPFYDLHSPMIELVRNSIFLFGWVALGCGELVHRYKVHRTIQTIVNYSKSKSI